MTTKAPIALPPAPPPLDILRGIVKPARDIAADERAARLWHDHIFGDNNPRKGGAKPKGLADIPPAQITPELLALTRSFGVKRFTALHEAATQGQLRLVQLKLLTPAAMNRPTEQGVTPLHCSVDNGHMEQVPSTLLTPETLTQPDYRGNTLLSKVIASGNLELIPLGSLEGIIAEEWRQGTWPKCPLSNLGRKDKASLASRIELRAEQVALRFPFGPPILHTPSPGLPAKRASTGKTDLGD